jgi:hypothetical protein
MISWPLHRFVTSSRLQLSAAPLASLILGQIVTKYANFVIFVNFDLRDLEKYIKSKTWIICDVVLLDTPPGPSKVAGGSWQNAACADFCRRLLFIDGQKLFFHK